ncbi:hypothetical protein [Alcanivorax sp.]|uniref:hypothetical protein n=1 Tax=Alcanivorax sp. TaxID=1872427 RepID=UPI000C0F6733|nr:hypothetical protein [Alcanivorax sp.]PHR65089.1 MAG: hypothetical protein COA55_12155 [Alcanivorax sp.]
MTAPYVVPGWVDLLVALDKAPPTDKESLGRICDAADMSLGNLQLGVSAIGELLVAASASPEEVDPGTLAKAGWLLADLGRLTMLLGELAVDADHRRRLAGEGGP